MAAARKSTTDQLANRMCHASMSSGNLLLDSILSTNRPEALDRCYSTATGPGKGSISSSLG